MTLVKQFLKEFKNLNSQDNNYNEYYTHDNYDPNTDELSHYGQFSHFEVITHTKDEIFTPHFHLINLETGEETYLKILKPEYCDHNGENTSLIDDEIDQLIEWLNAPYECLPRITNFKFVCTGWNIDYPNNQVEYNLEVPDYTKLKIFNT